MLLTASLQTLDEMTGVYLLARQRGETAREALRRALREAGLDIGPLPLAVLFGAPAAAQWDNANGSPIAGFLVGLLGGVAR